MGDKREHKWYWHPSWCRSPLYAGLHHHRAINPARAPWFSR